MGLSPNFARPLRAVAGDISLTNQRQPGLVLGLRRGGGKEIVVRPAIIGNPRGPERVLALELAVDLTKRVEMMVPQEHDKQPEAEGSRAGPLASIPSLGFSRRRYAERKPQAWRETVTRHLPESWPAARLALQARIAALDIES